jgi:alkylation response protein AidB-like acyl-CoA dehydrogenase
MTADGVDVKPIRQMTGGASFNEVFLTDVAVTDADRIGPVGAGWKVALQTLAFERRTAAGSMPQVGASWSRVLDLARHEGRAGDALMRQELARLYSQTVLHKSTVGRLQGSVNHNGLEGSIGKLLWTELMTETSNVVTPILGPALVADSGEWGTYCWSEHLLGAPGYRIAGGSDEIQRNIIGEGVLGLPREPRP